MPWKNMPPEWLAVVLDALRHNEFAQGLVAFFTAVFAAGVGIMARVAEEVKSGDRDKFFTKRLWLELPALLLVAIVTVGITAYYDLPGPVAAGVSVVFGFVGPKLADAWLEHRLRK